MQVYMLSEAIHTGVWLIVAILSTLNKASASFDCSFLCVCCYIKLFRIWQYVVISLPP